ncbi:MAG: 16S rRNA (cytosine(967)-C(5))-methyltransferase [Polyangiaceae bacterium UTPRO1]|nr:MAG: 16S rRNA (cytosine(967)-C(5))-methyltransferase [Polyangiaceae bacterium UTPRO1]
MIANLTAFSSTLAGKSPPAIEIADAPKPSTRSYATEIGADPRMEPGDPLAARALALDVLLRVDATAAHADATLAAALASTRLDARDRALASRLVYGTLAWLGRLDWQLARLTDRDCASFDPRVRMALRLGLYQITLLDRVPAHAAVTTSVDLAKRAVPAAGRLVNAVLRRAVRERNSLPLPDAARDPLAHLAVALSHPRWLVERWQRRFGDEVGDLLAADNEAAPTVLRARPGARDDLLARLRAAGIACEAGRFAPDAVRVQAVDPHALPGWSAGVFSVQEEASQLVTWLLDPLPGMRVLDACAAPGGKSAHAAERMRDEGMIAACDRRRRGALAIARNAVRLGLRSIRPLVLDARNADAVLARGSFDRILVDAPCSGLGTLRAHPEIRWRRSPDDLRRFAATQHRLLDAVTPLLRPGGVIVYATCTLTDEENDDVVERWLAAHPTLRREDAADILPPTARTLVDGRGALRTLPHRHGLDGFFAVRARRA